MTVLDMDFSQFCFAVFIGGVFCFLFGVLLTLRMHQEREERNANRDEHSPEHLQAVTNWLKAYEEGQPHWDVETRRQFLKWKATRADWDLYRYNQENPTK